MLSKLEKNKPMKPKSLALLPLLAIAFLASVAHAAEVQAKISLMTDDGAERPCFLRWLPADQKYVIVDPKTKSEKQIPPSAVRTLVVARPRNWQDLEQKANGRAPESAVSGLKALAAEYRMLQWDAEAGRLLAEIFLRKGQYKQAIKECAEIIRYNPSAAYDSPMAPVYWQAMIADKQTSGLASMLDKGAASGNRTVAAMACLRRGDMLSQEGKLNDALKDGYLRCIYLYPREAEARAEALFKASQAFDALHKGTYAEKMRQRLISEYGQSKWAREAAGAGH